LRQQSDSAVTIQQRFLPSAERSGLPPDLVIKAATQFTASSVKANSATCSLSAIAEPVRQNIRQEGMKLEQRRIDDGKLDW
jgi:hypothetical protein